MKPFRIQSASEDGVVLEMLAGERDEWGHLPTVHLSVNGEGLHVGSYVHLLLRPATEEEVAEAGLEPFVPEPHEYPIGYRPDYERQT